MLLLLRPAEFTKLGMLLLHHAALFVYTVLPLPALHGVPLLVKYENVLQAGSRVCKTMGPLACSVRRNYSTLCFIR